MSALENLALSLAELNNMQIEVEALRAENEELRKQRDHARIRVKDLRTKCETLERRADVLNGMDEEFLFENHCTIQFKTQFGDGRTVRILERKGGTIGRKDSKESSKTSALKAAMKEARQRVESWRSSEEA